MLSIYLLSLTKLLDKLSKLVLWLLLVAFFFVCVGVFFSLFVFQMLKALFVQGLMAML